MSLVNSNDSIYLIDVFTGESLTQWINEKGLSLCDYVIKIIIAIALYIIASKILKKITKETGLKFIISNLLDLVAGKTIILIFIEF